MYIWNNSLLYLLCFCYFRFFRHFQFKVLAALVILAAVEFQELRSKNGEYSRLFLTVLWNNITQESKTLHAFLGGLGRFKSFNMQFEELHAKQSQWIVPDQELRESLRLAVAEVLLPAYRSFIKRFGYVSSTSWLIYSGNWRHVMFHSACNSWLYYRYNLQ